MTLWALMALAGAAPPSQEDIDACANAQVANHMNGWLTYVEAFPSGVCAQAPAAADAQACEDARESDKPERWSAYLTLYPRGFCATEATEGLHRLAPPATTQPASSTEPPVAQVVGGADTSVRSTVAYGALDEASVDDVLVSLHGSLFPCGEGSVMFAITIDERGRVAEFEAIEMEPGVEACLSRNLKKLGRFPKSVGNTRATHRVELPADAGK